MSTRCYIGIQYDSRYCLKVDYIYCHSDGYPQGVGRTLLDHYNSYEKAKELISNGNMSGLNPTIDECNFYKDYDDEEWEDCKPKLHKCYRIEDIPSYIEYIYLYDQLFDEWKFCDTGYKELKSYLDKCD